MRKEIRLMAEMYAIGAVCKEQLIEVCSTSEVEDALVYAEAYGDEYDHYLWGLQIASEWGLEEEYNYSYFKDDMSVEDALSEWDLI